MNTYVNPVPGSFNSFPGYTNPLSHTGYPTPWSGFAPNFGGLPFGGGVPGFNQIPTTPFGYSNPLFGGSMLNGLGTLPGLYNGLNTGSLGATPWSTPWNTPFNSNFGGFSPIGTNNWNWNTIGQFPGLFNGFTGSSFSTPWTAPFNTIPFNTFPGLFNGYNNIPGYPINGLNSTGINGVNFPTTGLHGVPGFNIGGAQNIPFGGMPYGVAPTMLGAFPTPFIGQPWGYTPGYNPMINNTNFQPNVHGNVPFQANQGLCREAA